MNYVKSNQHKKLGRGVRYLRMVFFYNPLIASFFVLSFNGLPDFWSNLLISLSISVTVSNVIFFLTTISRNVQAKYYKAKELPVPETNYNSIRLISALGILPGLYLGFTLAGWVASKIGKSFEAPNFSSYATSTAFGLIFFVLFVLFDFWNSAKRAKQDSEIQIKHLENERLHAQLSALTAQMNPHLLFNALNTIASMIPTDPKGAEAVTVKLSELYRGVLESSQKMVHDLAAELKICETYLEIEIFRFDDRLKKKINIDSSIDIHSIQIPSLLLQPLVENAVKHGIAPKAAGGEIQITVKRNESELFLRVEDNGVGFGNSPAKNGSKSGMQNCRSRIELKYGNNGKFQVLPRDGGGTVIEITLPLVLEKETKNAEL